MPAFNAQGTTIARESDTTPDTYVSIGDIRSFSGPGGTANIIDATTLDSAGKEKVMGLADEGQLTLECNLNFANQQHLLLFQDRAQQRVKGFQITFSDASDTVVTFDAFVIGASVAGGVDQLTTLTLTLEVTGAVTWPAPAP